MNEVHISRTADTRNPFCVYVIVYRGDRLPPFYIGMTSTKKITDNGYHGSIASVKWKRIWKSELSNNPMLFRRKIIKTFSTRKEALEYENHMLRHFNSHKSPLFINMNINGTEFLGMNGSHSEASKIKMSNSHVKRSFTLVNPEGETFDFIGTNSLKSFGISSSSVVSVLNGRIKHVKGWHLPDTENAVYDRDQDRREFILVSPLGETVNVKGIRRFCKEHGLNTGGISRVLKGEYSQHKGWRMVNRQNH